MKRPEGFSAPTPPVPAERRTGTSASSASNTARDAAPAGSASPRRGVARGVTAATSAGQSERSARAVEREARALARAAARERRRAERDEVRRFTRRSRRRRATLATIAASSLVLVGGVAVVTLSPLMALEEITVMGTERLSSDEVAAALEDHRGTPLALLDEGQVEEDLAQFPLIRSYVTEIVPPHTLIVRIVERVPLAAIDRGGSIELVDAAGVVVERVAERPASIPMIAPESAEIGALSFESVTAVLSALPADLRAQVDVITATTRDDVTFSMTGAGHRVVWGSAESSSLKARVLDAAMATTDQSRPWEYDVSAPQALVVREL